MNGKNHPASARFPRRRGFYDFTFRLPLPLCYPIASIAFSFMPSDEIPPGSSSAQAITRKISLSEADQAVLQAAARRAGSSPDEMFERAVRYAFACLKADPVVDYFLRLAVIKRKAERLADECNDDGRKPTDAEPARIASGLEEIGAATLQLADGLSEVAERGSFPVPPAFWEQQQPGTHPPAG